MLNFAIKNTFALIISTLVTKIFNFPSLTQIEHADVCVIGAGFFWFICGY